MKEFNLEEAKAGKPVQTRDGRPARIICFDRKNRLYPIIALVDLGDYEDYISYTLDGCTNEHKKIENDRDLFMAPVKVTRWVNVYRGGFDYKFGSICPTRESALEAIDKAAGYISTAKIEWEE